MASLHPEKTEAGEPTSYELMEQKLTKVASQAGEDTRESPPKFIETISGMDQDVGGKTPQGNLGLHSETSFHTNPARGEPGRTADSLLRSENGPSHESSGQVVPMTSKFGAQDLSNSPEFSSTERNSNPLLSDTVEQSEQASIAVGPERQQERKVGAKHCTENESSPNESSKPSARDISSKSPEQNETSVMNSSSSDLPKVIQTEIASRTASMPSEKSPTSDQASNGGHSTRPKGTALRRGKWTMEEESYVARVIQDFNSGFLNAPAGTTLRSYLSEKLQCDPMRITKKFTGDSCIGKRVFHPAVKSAANSATIDKAQADLDALEKRWRRRLEMQQRESAKKAASIAASNVPSQGGRGHGMIQGVPLSLLNSAGQQTASFSTAGGSSGVAQAASWLDRANAILQGTRMNGTSTETSASENGDTASAQDSLPNEELESQMREVQRLIYEGPIIQQAAAGLPDMLNQGTTVEQPADKRMRTAAPISGAEDAEALVGFLRSVRASAASGGEIS